jgi:hypothetical protein
VDTLLGIDGAYVRYMPVISAAVAGATRLPVAHAALDTILERQGKGSTGGPDQAARSRSSSTTLATAYAADGRELNTVRLEGVNTYTFGFEMLAWAAIAAAAGKVNGPGALGPVAAFGLSELQAGVRAAGIERVRWAPSQRDD